MIKFFSLNIILRKCIVSIFILKKKLKFLIKIAKENPNEKFLLRPHPSEKENLTKLRKIFDKQRNIKVDLEGSIYDSILNSKLVISGPHHL